MKLLTVLILAGIILSILNSCNNKENDLNGIATIFASLEYRAVNLRNKRFLLADQIRFTQDSLLKKTADSDTVILIKRIEILNEEKQLLLSKSILLADSIKLQMDKIRANYLTDKNKEMEFNKLLQTALNNLGCK